MTDIVIRTKGRGILFDNNVVPTLGPEMFSRRHWWDRGLADRAEAGRGTVLFVGETHRNWALRHYHRGGWVGKVLTDHFMWAGEAKTRSFAEWRLLKRLRELGLPVPKPVAAHYRLSGFGYTADLITLRIPDALPLSVRLADGGVTASVWRNVGKTVRRFHDAGVCHVDLTAHNILLTSQGIVHLLDFDRGRILEPGDWTQSNLRRFQRSLRKVDATMDGVRLEPGHWEHFLEGYAGAPGEAPG